MSVRHYHIMPHKTDNRSNQEFCHTLSSATAPLTLPVVEVYNTGKHDFGHMQTNLCSLCILPRWIQIYYYNWFITNRFCDNFLKCNYNECSCFVTLPDVLNKAEALYYILNVVWAWKRNHDKDSRHVSPSQTARLCKLRHVLTRWDRNQK